MAMAERYTVKMAQLEALYKKYSDVPKEVIVKEDMQREGFRFTKAAIGYGQGKTRKTYQLFSWDQTKVEDMEEQKAPIQLPDTIDVEGGLYKLRRMRMRPRINNNSPYTIDVVEGRLTVLNEGVPLAYVKPYPKEPQYFSKTFDDGTPYHMVVPPDAYVIALRVCQHWGPDEECKFCDINANARSKKKLGQVNNLAPKDPVQVGIVMEEIFMHEEWEPGYRPVDVHINGGTVTKHVDGMDEVVFYMRYVTEIKKRIGNRWPINLQTHPHTKDKEKFMHENGVNVRMSNFEVWDPRLFKIICPGKERVIGRDEWIRRMIDQVDIYGEGNVAPGFVAGVEMAQPWGFKTVEEAVKSTREGLDFLMRHGIVPRPISWCVEALSELTGQEPPPIEYFIELDRVWYELWNKYQLPPATVYVPGPGRNTYPNSAAFDMGPVS